MTSPEFAEEVLDDLDVLRARDPRGLLPAVAGSGAQVRETARLTAEAGLGRITESGRPRGLVIVARREGGPAPRAGHRRPPGGRGSRVRAPPPARAVEPGDGRRRPRSDPAGLDRP